MEARTIKVGDERTRTVPAAAAEAAPAGVGGSGRTEVDVLRLLQLGEAEKISVHRRNVTARRLFCDCRLRSRERT